MDSLSRNFLHCTLKQGKTCIQEFSIKKNDEYKGYIHAYYTLFN